MKLKTEITIEPGTSITIIAQALSSSSGFSHIRVIQPMTAIAQIPGTQCHITESNWHMNDLSEEVRKEDSPKILILQRPILENGSINWLRPLFEDGWIIVNDYDDNPHCLPTGMPAGAFTFRGVHAVQTSTTALASLLSLYNPEVAVFPNSIDQAPTVRNFINHDRLTLFFGCINRGNDWSEIMPALNDVLNEAGEHIFVCVVSDEAFFKALTTPHKQFIPYCEYGIYLDLLSQSDISLMPLIDTPFNRCKSDLKFIEASAARVLPLPARLFMASPLIMEKPDSFFIHRKNSPITCVPSSLVPGRHRLWQTKLESMFWRPAGLAIRSDYDLIGILVYGNDATP